MKSVLISIQPKWCELVASGKKTVEVRKTKPKIETPFKCYIYETKDAHFEHIGVHYADGQDFIHHIGKVIGEFVCDKIYDIKPHFDTPTFPNQYICGWEYGEEHACLSFEELTSYLNGKQGYAWHISNLVIYDKPRELSEFERACPDNVRSCAMCRHSGYSGMKCTPLKRPPQSWCYVEEMVGDVGCTRTTTK